MKTIAVLADNTQSLKRTLTFIVFRGFQDFPQVLFQRSNLSCVISAKKDEKTSCPNRNQGTFAASSVGLTFCWFATIQGIFAASSVCSTFCWFATIQATFDASSVFFRCFVQATFAAVCLTFSISAVNDVP